MADSMELERRAHSPEPGATHERPRTAAEARLIIERARDSMSDTLDAIEDRVAEKKRELKDRAHPRRLFEERPLLVLGAALALGLLLGGIGGGRRERRVVYVALDADALED